MNLLISSMKRNRLFISRTKIACNIQAKHLSSCIGYIQIDVKVEQPSLLAQGSMDDMARIAGGLLGYR